MLSPTTPTFDPRNLSPSNFFDHANSLGLSERASRRLLGAVFGSDSLTVASWREKELVSKDFASKISDLPRLELVKVQRSLIDGFTKLLLKTHDNLAIETVVIPLNTPDTATLCLSSQVGCVMRCAFCATAKMASRRNLATWEIIDQFMHARTIASQQGRKITGAVFMGMGEPFLNYENVLAAAKLLSFPVQGTIAGKGITVSTVGLVNEIERFAEEGKPFRLSISLGAATDQKRKILVPVAARTPVSRVMEAGRHFAITRNTRINLAYVCVGGVNCEENDARALGELIADTPTRLDLITVTDISGRYQPPSDLEFNTFRDALRKYVNHPIVRRYSGGEDIQAACGTLAGEG